MHKTSKKSRFGGWWKALAVVMIFGYTMSSVLAYDLSGDQIVSLQSSVSSLPAPSFQKQIETEVALGAQTLWTNLVAFMQQGMKTDSDAGFTSQPESPVGLPESHVDLPVTSSVLQYVATTSVPAFGDIDNDANKASIELLTSIGVFKVGENGKFYPNNFVRCSDFIRVIVDVYRYKLGYPLDGQMGLLDKPYFDPANKDTLLLKKLNTAQALGLLDKLDVFMLDEHITPAQAKQIFNNILDLNPYIGQKEKVNQISSSNSLITKSQLAGYLAMIFQLEKNVDSSVFVDISNHKYQASITKLAQLGVVAGTNGYFYPDNDVLRADGIIMIANSLLRKKSASLSNTNFIHINTINDTTYFAPFASHLEYLLVNEIGDTLLYPQQSGYLFLPHAQLTRGEAYTLLSQATRVKLLNIDPGESAKPITRGELASLIVDAFDFSISAPSQLAVDSNQPIAGNQYAARREENKGILVAFLKDILDTL